MQAGLDLLLRQTLLFDEPTRTGRRQLIAGTDQWRRLAPIGRIPGPNEA